MESDTQTLGVAFHHCPILSYSAEAAAAGILSYCAEAEAAGILSYCA